MGEAKRRRESGEMECWFHGTNEYFDAWAPPPVTTRLKPELLPHPFLSLTKDKDLAQGAGLETGGLCRAKLLPSAKVLDLRSRSGDARIVWERVRETEHGRLHAYLETFESWVDACHSGKVLRMVTRDPVLLIRPANMFKRHI